MVHPVIAAGLGKIIAAITEMNAAFPHRKFTMDGRLVGDIGEIVAELEYDLTADKVSRSVHDAVTSDGRHVQVKAGFGETLTFGKVPEYYLGLKLFPDGSHREIYNGPGHIIYQHFKKTRQNFGENLQSVSQVTLIRLSETVPDDERIKKRFALCNKRIDLRGGGYFTAAQLVEHIRTTGRNYITQGQQVCNLELHTKPNSLDVWLRKLAANPNTKQADSVVTGYLLETGAFQYGPVTCPDSGHSVKGLRLTSEQSVGGR